jgi:hypothetical protein
MKRYFVSVLAVLVIVTSVLGGKCSRATTSTKIANLDLVIEGPFLICEAQDQKNIVIAIPKLDGNHYVPGLTAGLYEYSLGDGEKYRDYTHYVLNLQHNGNGKMAKKSVGRSAILYTEKGPCEKNLRSASIAIVAPRPDEIWPLTTGGDAGTVWATHPTPPGNGTPPPAGPCSTDCAYANKVVLRYLHTNLPGVKLTCDDGDCPKPAPLPEPDVGDVLVAIGHEAMLELDAVPVIIAEGGISVPPISVPPLKAYPSCRDIVYPSNKPPNQTTATIEEESEAFCATTTIGYQSRYYIPVMSHPQIGKVHRDCASIVTLITQE